jgi:hypothetical protein
LNLDVFGISAAQRYMIALDEELDRITQGCDPLDQYRLTADKTHFHETPARAPPPANSEDPGALSRLKIA